MVSFKTLNICEEIFLQELWLMTELGLLLPSGSKHHWIKPKIWKDMLSHSLVLLATNPLEEEDL